MKPRLIEENRATKDRKKCAEQQERNGAGTNEEAATKGRAAQG